MDDSCVARFGPLGCYRFNFPKVSRPPSSMWSSGAADTAGPSSGGADLSPGDDDEGGDSDRPAMLGGVIAGVLGGVILLAGMGFVAVRGLRVCGVPSLLGPKSRGGGTRPGEGRADRDSPLDPPSRRVRPGNVTPTAREPFLDKGVPSPVAGSTTASGSVAIAMSTGPVVQASFLLSDPLVPITALTPPRADMQLLSTGTGPGADGAGGAPSGAEALKAEGEDNAVKLLPDATIGKGFFGRVVEGVYQGQRVAVKVVSDAHQFGGPGESLIRSFAQEVEVLGRCTHPNVVRLLAACLTPPRLCLVMELMETSLDRVLYGKPESTPLPLPTVLHISLEVAKGLEYLHPTITHRDLKPGNVLLNEPHSPRPTAKLADFGLSRLRSTVVPTVTPDAGTPAYLAPEGFDAANYVITHQADMYSLAVLVWEMLAGSKPWQGCSLYEVAHALTTRGARLPLDSLPEARCPPRLRALLQQCWERDPRRRPAAAEAVKALSMVLAEVEGTGQLQRATSLAFSAAEVSTPPPPRVLAESMTPSAMPQLASVASGQGVSGILEPRLDAFADAAPGPPRGVPGPQPGPPRPEQGPGGAAGGPGQGQGKLAVVRVRSNMPEQSEILLLSVGQSFPADSGFGALALSAVDTPPSVSTGPTPPGAVQDPSALCNRAGNAALAAATAVPELRAAASPLAAASAAALDGYSLEGPLASARLLVGVSVGAAAGAPVNDWSGYTGGLAVE
ncbi:hypothetical protein HYH03_014683 [Edaphochlamys debaryana]|uniref:Protein kinase domain-containing protein n=1 Tax=Edaphochlamys debaryana TaxID=47281 RepID=A0A836BRP0_9CHLO|nr:hypothetical protein HYH03_014683 [Edaphochlamys debaryana]|eukprot:KAG2486626.1 hypothetical protein HYH03_014683 [Edaphochlamys debaryana]